MHDGGDGSRTRDVVREDEEGVLPWDDTQPKALPKGVEDVVLGFGGLAASPLAVGVALVGFGVAAPEAPDEGGFAFFDEGVGSAFGELLSTKL